MPRKYNIICWGATGFTGKLVAEYLTINAPSTVKFAIAGRNQNKLEQVRNELKKLNRNRGDEDIPIIIADSADQESLDLMVSQTEVIISTVGPFQKYGVPLVDACVRCKTNYVDSTGEPFFIQTLIEKYHDSAVRNNVLIVPSCGFDSIPSDLGTFMVASHLKKKGLKTDKVEMAVMDVEGGVSGGTLATSMNILKSNTFLDLFKSFNNPDQLSPSSIHNGKIHKFTLTYFSKGLRSWLVPFFMEYTNLRYVRRSNGLLEYGPHFQYSEGVRSPNIVHAFLATILMGIASLLFILPPVQYVIGKISPPGTGPSEQQRNNGHFTINFYGEGVGADGKVHAANAVVKGINDPGYGETSKMLCESALCLVLDKDRLQTSTNGFKLLKGGIVTAASGMGSVLIDRLRVAGMTFQVSDYSDSQ